MNTQTHVIMGAVLFGRDIPKRAWAAAAGGIAPDIAMLLIVAVLKFYSIPDPIIFGFLYWQEWWQMTNAISHNFWLWGIVLSLGILLRERLSASVAAIDRANLVIAFAGSALLHVAIDFLCHREDAHMSFWPVTRWKFISPVSYWDPAFYGQWFSLFEMALGIALAVVLYRRFKSFWLRAALLAAIGLYLAVPFYFIVFT